MALAFAAAAAAAMAPVLLVHSCPFTFRIMPGFLQLLQHIIILVIFLVSASCKSRLYTHSQWWKGQIESVAELSWAEFDVIWNRETHPAIAMASPPHYALKCGDLWINIFRIVNKISTFVISAGIVIIILTYIKSIYLTGLSLLNIIFSCYVALAGAHWDMLRKHISICNAMMEL